ncbi:response regulator [Desulfobotulus mexicanus]|uniref:Response regulator n=1 Tax=Desulfobotulus mexicanus TaxID=2586642 RepID=A0A5Q4VGA6_9BACT|nr:response regulator [Desulfobotulus mexicanus]TYT75397.1 response regulator [Desulfobotulus mexicanus]
MHLHVLIADPDTEIAKRMAGWIENHGERFKCMIVGTGMEAIEILKNSAVNILITELILPDLDGFSLLDTIQAEFPEIPSIVISAHGKPKTREILLRKGAEDFLEKPLQSKDFLAAFENMFRRIQDGGSLNGASLDTFAQMIEMEQKTCTLRVMHPPSNGYGILFFKDGEIIHSRIPGEVAIDGISAAYKVLAWQPVSLMIENQCKAINQTIHSDLQAILMEAMRLKDEMDQEEDDLSIAIESALPELHSEEELISDYKEIDPLQNWLNYMEDQSPGIESVYKDASWRDLLLHAHFIGDIFEAGPLEACYVNMEEASESIILPDGKDTVIAVRPACKRELMIKLLVSNPPGNLI